MHVSFEVVCLARLYHWYVDLTEFTSRRSFIHQMFRWLTATVFSECVCTVHPFTVTDEDHCRPAHGLVTVQGVKGEGKTPSAGLWVMWLPSLE